mmetsp:Transcript_10756/g.27776  ORF Transcript_10756/g.27776 Transcript_10756/m.27776 type:complete len:296 (-) Transcript_10756:113-1000(-)
MAQGARGPLSSECRLAPVSDATTSSDVAWPVGARGGAFSDGGAVPGDSKPCLAASARAPGRLVGLRDRCRRCHLPCLRRGVPAMAKEQCRGPRGVPEPPLCRASAGQSCRRALLDPTRGPVAARAFAPGACAACRRFSTVSALALEPRSRVTPCRLRPSARGWHGCRRRCLYVWRRRCRHLWFCRAATAAQKGLLQATQGRGGRCHPKLALAGCAEGAVRADFAGVSSGAGIQRLPPGAAGPHRLRGRLGSHSPGALLARFAQPRRRHRHGLPGGAEWPPASSGGGSLWPHALRR